LTAAHVLGLLVDYVLYDPMTCVEDRASGYIEMIDGRINWWKGKITEESRQTNRQINLNI